MTERYEVRPLGTGDLPACLALSVERGWPAEELKWRVMLAHGRGFALDGGGGLAGTVLRFDYGARAATIAMLLVRAALERRGLGRRLMQAAMDGASAPLFLYATEAGRPLYDRLGFVALDTIHKFVGRVPRTPAPRGVTLRPLDAASFGAPRRALLAALHARSARALVAERDGRAAGYGLAWPNVDVLMIGPLVAPDDETALALASALAADHALPARIDLPSRFASVRAHLAARGLDASPPAPLMSLGGRALPGDRDRLYAVAARAFG